MLPVIAGLLSEYAKLLRVDVRGVRVPYTEMLVADAVLLLYTPMFEFQLVTLEDHTPRLLAEYAAFEVHNETGYADAERLDAQELVLHPQDAALDAKNVAGAIQLEENATLGYRFDANQAAFEENPMFGNRLEENREALDDQDDALDANEDALLEKTDALEPNAATFDPNTEVLLENTPALHPNHAALDNQGIPLEVKTDCANARDALRLALTTEFDENTAALHPNTEALDDHAPMFEDHAPVLDDHDATADAVTALFDENADALDPKTAMEFWTERAFVTAEAEGGRLEDPPTSPRVCTIPR